MAALLEVAGGATAFAASATRYTPFSEVGIVNAAGEATQQVKRESAGTFSGLCLRISLNSLSGSATITFRKNTANGNQTLSISAAATGEFQDTSNSDLVVATDLVCLQLVMGTGTSITVNAAGILFSNNSGTVKRLMQWGGQTTTTALRMYPLVGSSASNTSTTDAAVSFQIGTPGSLQNLFAKATSNTDSVATTVTSRVNGAGGNMSVSVTASTTGTFEDLVNTDALNLNDLVNLGFNGGAGTGTCTFRAGCDFATVSNLNQFIVTGAGAGNILTQSGNQTRYYTIGGTLLADSTEVNQQVQAQVPMLLSGMVTRVTANSLTQNATLRLRVNAGNGNQSVSITLSSTGIFQDTTNTDSVVATAELDYQLATVAGGTSVSFTNIGLTAANIQNVPPGPVPVRPATFPLLVQ